MFLAEDKVRESNRIEGIHRDPTPAELLEFEEFLDLDEVWIDDLINFVQIYAPGNRLRDRQGLDVMVGGHLPPVGGPEVPGLLQRLLEQVNLGDIRPFDAHIQYEMLHPFTDGNGRSGRMLWYWMMYKEGNEAPLGFLHTFYYQTLRKLQNGNI